MSSLIPGLVSVSFRPLAPQELIALVVKGGLKAIEWGGDIHVPHGDVARAKEVGQQTCDAGLAVAAYGSYYKLGVSEVKGLAFERVLESAVALGAPVIRVWAGAKGSRETTPDERNALVADALRIAGLAQARNITVSLEYHADTLTDTADSVRLLLKELTHPYLNFLWQTSNGETEEQCIARLKEVLPRTGNIHVFHWWPTGKERHPLADGEACWRHYFELIKATGKSRACLLEFVRNDNPDQFLQDAATLRRLLEA